MSDKNEFKPYKGLLIGLALLFVYGILDRLLDRGDPTGRAFVSSPGVEIYSNDWIFYILGAGMIFTIGGGILFFFNDVIPVIFKGSDVFLNWLNGESWLARIIHVMLTPIGWISKQVLKLLLIVWLPIRWVFIQGWNLYNRIKKIHVSPLMFLVVSMAILTFICIIGMIIRISQYSGK